MTSYRFCRPDDMHLLIKAINDCVITHFPEQRRIDSDSYRSLARELNLWASSCMVALEKDADDVVSAIIGCRRDDETLIYMVGNRPDSSRSGHINHMLRSLSGKLSILGPPRMVAEIPEDSHRVVEIFEGIGFTQSSQCTDFEIGDKLDPLSEIPVERLKLSDVPPTSSSSARAWVRQWRTIENAQDSLDGFGIVSSERLESYLFIGAPGSHFEDQILHIGFEDERSLIALLRWIATERGSAVRIPQIRVDEVPYHILSAAGFRKGETYLEYRREAEMFS